MAKIFTSMNTLINATKNLWNSVVGPSAVVSDVNQIDTSTPHIPISTQVGVAELREYVPLLEQAVLLFEQAKSLGRNEVQAFADDVKQLSNAVASFSGLPLERINLEEAKRLNAQKDAVMEQLNVLMNRARASQSHISTGLSPALRCVNSSS